MSTALNSAVFTAVQCRLDWTALKGGPMAGETEERNANRKVGWGRGDKVTSGKISSSIKLTPKFTQRQTLQVQGQKTAVCQWQTNWKGTCIMYTNIKTARYTEVFRIIITNAFISVLPYLYSRMQTAKCGLKLVSVCRQLQKVWEDSGCQIWLALPCFFIQSRKSDPPPYEDLDLSSSVTILHFNNWRLRRAATFALRLTNSSSPFSG